MKKNPHPVLNYVKNTLIGLLIILSFYVISDFIDDLISGDGNNAMIEKSRDELKYCRDLIKGIIFK